MAPRVLGIDPSLTATALVGIDSAGALVSRHLLSTSKKDFASRPARLDAMRRALLEIITSATPDLVTLEGYSFGSKNQTHQLGEWGGVLRWTLWSEMVPYIEVPPTTLKSYVTGKGNSPKEVIMREVFRRWGYEAHDNDDADAYGLARFGLDYLSNERSKAFATLVGKIEIVAT